jgi:hypothetical protein
MAMQSGDYKRRVQSANRGASVGAGFAVDPVPVPGDNLPHEVAAAGNTVTVISLLFTSTAGMNVWFQDSTGTKQELIPGATIARDYKLHFYCPWPLYVSCDVAVLVMVAPLSKGETAG